MTSVPVPNPSAAVGTNTVPQAPSSNPPQMQADAAGRLLLQGHWTAAALAAPGHWAPLRAALAQSGGPNAVADATWDLSAVTRLDHIGAQLLWHQWGRRWPAQLVANASQRELLTRVSQYTQPAGTDPVQTPTAFWAGWLKRILALSRLTHEWLELVGQLTLDVGRALRDPRRFPWRDLSGHLYHIGATALPITALVGLLIGVVLAYLTSQQLRQYGAETFVVNILGLALIRELGPVLAAVLIAGRSGSAITAQIGVMRVTEELDAMRVMGIAHGFRLVLPRVLALAIAMPLISVWTTAAALLGGMLAARAALDISFSYFLQALPAAVPFGNVLLALAKSVVFGMLIALIGCHFGMKVQPNTESLGRGTTASVVSAITVVILIDALFAVLFRSVGFK